MGVWRSPPREGPPGPNSTWPNSIGPTSTGRAQGRGSCSCSRTAREAPSGHPTCSRPATPRCSWAAWWRGSPSRTGSGAPELLVRRSVRTPPGSRSWPRCGTWRPGPRWVQGGRSNGARVACRTAAAVGARAVIALAFPLRPPRRSPEGAASRAARGTSAAGLEASETGAVVAAHTRAAELHAARASGARVLVVNGDRDPFGIPGAQDADRVVVVTGETHALKGHRAAIVAAIVDWLPTVL